MRPSPAMLSAASGFGLGRRAPASRECVRCCQWAWPALPGSAKTGMRTPGRSISRAGRTQ
eukprot:4957411-Lingulodinium_polyedra.AAC.1